MGLVSVIIPTYNDVNLLSKALDSVINQKKIELEIIIVDDSVNNDIENYLKNKSDKRIRYFHNHQGIGTVKNWNYGLSLAKGEYITVLHHDEFYEDYDFHLLHCLSHLENDSDIVVSSIVVNKNNTYDTELKIPKFVKKNILMHFPSLLFFVNVIGPVSCVVFKKKCLVPFDEDLNWLVDVDWYYRLLKRGKRPKTIDKCVKSSHGHEFQITSNINLDLEKKKDSIILKRKYRRNNKIIIYIYISGLIKLFLDNLFSGFSLFKKKKD